MDKQDGVLNQPCERDSTARRLAFDNGRPREGMIVGRKHVLRFQLVRQPLNRIAVLGMYQLRLRSVTVQPEEIAHRPWPLNFLWQPA